MASSVTTSIVVQFSSSSGDGILSVEVDDREPAEGGLNGGKTSFLPGDPVRLLLYKSDRVLLQHYESSLGSVVASAGYVAVQKTEDITFAGETEASLRYPTTGPVSVQWLGRNLGTAALVGDSTMRVPEPALGDYAVGVARVSYTTMAKVFTLTHSDLGLGEYPIVVFFVGTSE